MNSTDVSGGLEKSIVERLERQEPSEAEKKELREQHEGHLVRRTHSQLSMDMDVGEGVEADATAEVPDMFCFTCDEWVGLSGVDLRGKPRSRTDAFYLGGMPPTVLHAKNSTDKTLNELADALVERVEHLSERREAYDFIETEIEALKEVSADAE